MTSRLARVAAPLALLTLPAAAQDVPAANAEQYWRLMARDQLATIAGRDDAGPELNAVIVVKDKATVEKEIAAAKGLPLQGRTVLVKDNIETREWPTTAGSLALKDNMPGRDAPLIARLRAAGGVVLGKTNLSEWANIRSSGSTSGWSAVGGLTKNPHATDRNACGSSSGSGAAVAAGMAWAAIGTETDGSVTCPASVNGIVGLKPTVGLVSRTYVVPISSSQDTAGPMARSVGDVALLLSAIAGPEPVEIEGRAGITVAQAVAAIDKAAAAHKPLDPANAESAAHMTDFTAGLDTASLKGKRIGVLRNYVGNDPRVEALFDAAVADLKRAGAVVVPIDYEMPKAMGDNELPVLLYELRVGLDGYLKGSPANIPVRSLADVIAFDKAHADAEMRWFGQDLFEQAMRVTAADYRKRRAENLLLAGPQGIDKLLAANKVSLLIAPTVGPAWTTDLVNGDHYNGSIGATSLAAIAGYPHLTVPMGAVEGLPVGLSFIGAKWSDHALLMAGAAYERARTAKLPVPSLKPWGPGKD
jgi:amidase